VAVEGLSQTSVAFPHLQHGFLLFARHKQQVVLL